MTDYEYKNPYIPPKKSLTTPSKFLSPRKNQDDNDGNSFTYFIKSPLSTKFLYFIDIMISSIIFFILLVLLITPITYIFDKPLTNYPQSAGDPKDKVTENKFVVFIEIIIELSLIVIVICIVYIITERINIFRIKNINHNEVRRIFFHVMTGISIISMHRILQDKIEYIFGNHKTGGLLG